MGLDLKLRADVISLLTLKSVAGLCLLKGVSTSSSFKHFSAEVWLSNQVGLLGLSCCFTIDDKYSLEVREFNTSLPSFFVPLVVLSDF